MEAVFKDWPDFGPNSIMLDIGSGISRPQVHALAQFGVCSSIGVEFDEPKCLKALPFIQKACAALGKHGVHVDASGVIVLHGSSSKLTTLEPCTHLYLCWQGWGDKDMAHIAALVKASPSVFCVCIVQHRRKDAVALEGAGWPAMQLVNAREVVLSKPKGLEDDDTRPEKLRACTYLVVGRSPSPTRHTARTGLLAAQPYVRKEQAWEMGQGPRRSNRLKA